MIETQPCNVMFCRVCGFRVKGYGSLTELPEVSGTGMKVLQNFQKFRVFWHGRRELAEVTDGYKMCCTRYVIRLSLGKLLVNLLQVVKRTNTPLIP